ncbi:MAG TPA: hypothetical protein VGL65_00865 [Gemmatimonadales bacterium]|jgi:hypothetical protein
MSTVIRLDIVLREAVATPYRDLVTRPTGAAVRNRVITVLRDTVDDDAALDFSEVGLIDFSCADEVVAKLLVVTLGQRIPRLVLRGVQEHHADAIDQALLRYDLVIVAVLADGVEPSLLGAATDDWRTAFGALARLGRAPIRPVADALAWPVARAADALRGLESHRCVVAYPDATFATGAVA